MSAKTAIYLDSNATAPLRPQVAEALSRLLTSESSLGNPSSIHFQGRIAKRYLTEARDAVALSLGQKVDPDQIVFSSSGTESNQTVIRSVLEPALLPGEKPHWLLSAVEHSSNLDMVEWFKAHGGVVDTIPVTSDGLIEPEKVVELLRPETKLVSLIWVNNETGVISHVAKIAKRVRENSKSDPRPLIHVDAAQAWGKIPIRIEELQCDYLTLSGQKIGAPAGTGVTWINRRVPYEALLRGKQEKGRRGGTENLLGLVGLGVAADLLKDSQLVIEKANQVQALRDRLQSAICERIPGTKVNGGSAPRVANTLNLNFQGVVSDSLVMALDLEGYCVSAGSACSSGVTEPSRVLLAMGRSREDAASAIRVSLAFDTTWENLEGFVDALERVVARVRSLV